MQDTDLAWLAGIWEGEGSILLYPRVVNENKTSIVPSLEVSNTDVFIMNRVRKLLEEIGCNFSWRQYRPKKGTRDCYRLASRNAFYIQLVLEKLNPFMYGEKKALGETLLAFVTRRAEKARLQNKDLKHFPYDDEDLSYVRSSTTTRETPSGEDIVYS